MTRPAPGPQTPVHSIQQPLSISTLVHVALALFTQSSALRLPALAPKALLAGQSTLYFLGLVQGCSGSMS